MNSQTRVVIGSGSVGMGVAAVVGACIAAMMSSACMGQCMAQWTAGYEGNGGQFLPGAWDSIVHDDGSGPALFACTNGGRIYKFDGARWYRVGIAMANTVGGASGITYSFASVDPDGPGALGRQLFVTGNFRRVQMANGTSVEAHGVARWDGTNWFGEGATSMSGQQVLASTAFDDGAGEKLVVGGAFNIGSGYGIAIRDFDGSWMLVGEGLGGYLTAGAEVNALHAYDDGDGMGLYIGGLFEGIGGVASPGVIRWTGTGWVGLGAGVRYTTGEGGRVYGLASFDDGSGLKLYASGNIHTAGGQAAQGVGAWDGTTWTGVGAGYAHGFIGPFVRVLDAADGAQLYAYGRFVGSPSTGVTRWNGGGWTSLPWDSVVQGHPLTTNAFDVDGAGPLPARLVACGGRPYQFADGAWLPLPHYPNSQATSVTGDMVTLDVDGAGPEGPAVFAMSSSVTSVNGQVINRLGRFDGSGWSAAFGGLPNLELRDTVEGTAVPYGPECAQVFDDGTGARLYVGGAFNTNDGVRAARIVKWDGAQYVEVGGGIGDVLNNGEIVNAMTVFDPPGATGARLYACGRFSSAGGMAVNNIASWDGVSWTDVGGGVIGVLSCSVVFDDGSGPALYVGGTFSLAGGVAASNIARWDGTSWSDVGGGCNGEVVTLLVHDDGNGPALYAGGRFASAGGVSVNRIARWDGTAWTGLAGGIARSAGNTANTASVRALASLREGSSNVLIAGGLFELAGGNLVNHIARWNGVSWSGLDLGIGSTFGNLPSVNTMAVFEDTPGAASLFVAGSFDTTGTINSGAFARWGCAPPPVCNADYNQDGGADNSDIVDLANDVAAGTQSFPPSSPDFNNDGSADNGDIIDLANVVAGGNCP